MKLLLTGGGTGGPVMPVLAVAAEIAKLKPKTEFLFVGTRKGPERAMVTETGIEFVAIPAARWRRFYTLKNLAAPFVFIAGLLKAWLVVRRFRPDVIFSAGGFVGVPVCWVGNFLGSKIVIHQQDVRIGLANKLVAPLADKITTTFEGTAKMFFSGSGLMGNKPKPAAEWVGNPVRSRLTSSKSDAKKYFHLHDELPILLILGGATGSRQINELIGEILPQLIGSFQVVHQTGTGKSGIRFKHSDYHPIDLIPYDEYASILKRAHLVVARAGLGTISELSKLSKAAIIIPMPNTHQEDNAKLLAYTASAAVLMGKLVNGPNLLKVINKLNFNPEAVSTLSTNIGRLLPHDAAPKLAKIIIDV